MSKIPANLQFELALLWRSLSVIKSIEGLSEVDFYENLIPTVKGMPKLSLSTYWEQVCREVREEGKGPGVGLASRVGVPDGGSRELMDMHELDYLKHETRIDRRHDPLQLVQQLYSAAAVAVGAVGGLVSAAYSRDILLSACLVIAVKSGRASLLLHLALLLATLSEADANTDAHERGYPSPGQERERGEGEGEGVDLEAMRDICEHLLAAQTAQALRAHHNVGDVALNPPSGGGMEYS
ncbi:hypothetical protein B484DRAFT_132022, partial [Ochromonadaceae sp. CCMP2298]